MSIDFNFKKGVTLIEMLLVVSLLSVVGLTIYQSITNGMKVWERSQRFVTDEDISIFLEKLSQDLRNAMNYSLIPFKGRKEKVMFSTIVRTPADKKATVDQGYIHQIGKVEYFFDKGRRSLFRRQANYSQALEEEFGTERVIASSIHSVDFSYYYGGGGTEGVTRKADGVMPSAIKIDIKFLEDTGKIREMTRLIPVPVGT